MDVDINQYRAAIGSFIPQNNSYKCLKSYSKSKMRKQQSMFINIKFILIQL